ncbi:unnamed protein product [Ranitomeya imitator]|uniref:Uncharacterized protein n=1 Tax=Ranitomeya imitator TaxID=111125 RepID=A0ABN9LN04_9NEOB|nr:unnamed protein product [Ranitomeya imitator]
MKPRDPALVTSADERIDDSTRPLKTQRPRCGRRRIRSHQVTHIFHDVVLACRAALNCHPEIASHFRPQRSPWRQPRPHTSAQLNALKMKRKNHEQNRARTAERKSSVPSSVCGSQD